MSVPGPGSLVSTASLSPSVRRKMPRWVPRVHCHRRLPAPPHLRDPAGLAAERRSNDRSAGNCHRGPRWPRALLLHPVEPELPMTLPGAGDGATDPDVRSDVVYCAYPNGGAVFSVGSMAWVTSLLHDGGENGISRITLNVIRHFLSEAGGSHADARDEAPVAGSQV